MKAKIPRVSLPSEYKMKDVRRAELEVLAEKKTREKMREYDSFAIELVVLGVILTRLRMKGMDMGRGRRRFGGCWMVLRGGSEGQATDTTKTVPLKRCGTRLRRMV